jgi:acetolactate synthase-1/2/3 large subunit
MNGAQSLIESLRDAGVELCLANPGTTEMPLVAALDTVSGLRSVLGLFEGVCTGAADGYARMTDKPAMTLLHLGPGLSNGAANLHNARRANSPVINLVGDHATWHLAADPPLASDIESLARPVSHWVHTTTRAADLARDGLEAWHQSMTAPGRIATLIVPQDCQSDAGGTRVRVPTAPSARPADAARVGDAAALLRKRTATVLLLGARALRERGLRAAARIAASTGCRLVHETFPARLERGGGLPSPERLGYFPELALQQLAGTADLILAGARRPVAFFGYPDMPSDLVPHGCDVFELASPEDDVEATLEGLADSVGRADAVDADLGERPTAPRDGALDAEALGRTIAALMPDDSIVVDEAATSGLNAFLFAAAAPRHSWLTLTGGAIGQGLPNAVGAALACRDRKVIAFQADGSAMYTLQSLWTMAREQLDVVVVICANRVYRILQVELMRAGIAEPGKTAMSLTDLGAPELDWVALARGHGVPARRATTAAEFTDAFARAVSERGPALVEAVI